ncbi:MAG TPA: DedA family protein [Clostridia bacterium]
MLESFLIPLVRHYGSVVIFVSLILEYIGLPVPGEPMMSFLGFLNSKSPISIVVISIIFAIAGTFTGSFIAWFIGIKYGEPVLLKYGKYIHITKERLDASEELFRKYKTVLLLFGRYVPGVRHVVPYLSGMSKINPAVFCMYNLIGSVLWCIPFIGMGYILGEKWTVVEALVKEYSLILLFVLLYLFVIIKLVKRNRVAILSITLPIILCIILKITGNLPFLR